MRSLAGIFRRSLFSSRFLLLAPKRIRVFPIESCMISIPVGSPMNISLVDNLTRVIVDYKLMATLASVNEDDVAEAELSMILAAIQKAPMSTEEICVGYLRKLCNAKNVLVAARLLQFLQNRNICPGPDAYDIIMEAAGEANQVEIMFRVFKDLVMSCESLPSSSYLNLAKGFLNTNDDGLILRLVKEVSELTFPRSTLVINRIIFAFAECRMFDKALLIFDQIRDLKCKPDLIMYNMVLDILGRATRVDEMLHEFSSMKDAGIVPDFISYNTLLHQLQKAGRLDLCLVYIEEMIESGIEPDLLTYTSLIYSFGKSGHIQESLRLFDDMKKRQIRPSIYIYRSLINSAKKTGKAELAMTLLEEMNASLQDLAGPNEFKRKRTKERS